MASVNVIEPSQGSGSSLSPIRLRLVVRPKAVPYVAPSPPPMQLQEDLDDAKFCSAPNEWSRVSSGKGNRSFPI